MSSKDEMCDGSLGVPIDDRQRREIECCVRDHGKPNASGDGDDGAEDETDDGRLLDARESLQRVVRCSEARGRDGDD